MGSTRDPGWENISEGGFRGFIRWWWCGQRPSSNIGSSSPLWLFPLCYTNESPEVSFVVWQSHGSAKIHPCVSKLICLTFNHIPVLGCRPSPAHPIFLSRDWQSSSSSILFFWAFIFLFGLQRVAAPIFGGVFPLQGWSLSAVKQWGQLVVSCLHGKETSPGGQGPWPYSDLHVLSPLTSVWSRTRVCHMSSCRKQQSSWRILAWNSGYVAGIFKCSALWLMVTSLLWNLKWTIMERELKKIAFKRNFLG